MVHKVFLLEGKRRAMLVSCVTEHCLLGRRTAEEQELMRSLHEPQLLYTYSKTVQLTSCN